MSFHFQPIGGPVSGLSVWLNGKHPEFLAKLKFWVLKSVLDCDEVH